MAEIKVLSGAMLTHGRADIGFYDATFLGRGHRGATVGRTAEGNSFGVPGLFISLYREKEENDMRTSITVGQVLRSKGQGFWYVAPSMTAYEALEIMADKNVGALLVVEGGKLMGVFSERDYARKVILRGKSSKSTEVRDLMTSPPICIGPEKSIHECMVLMTKNHIRHVPVVDLRGLTGVVSIGDIVNSIISDQEATIEELESYITVGY